MYVYVLGEDVLLSIHTGNLCKAVPMFGEFCACCCLPLLPQLVCSILAIWEQPYRDSVYMSTHPRRSACSKTPGSDLFVARKKGHAVPISKYLHVNIVPWRTDV